MALLFSIEQRTVSGCCFTTMEMLALFIEVAFCSGGYVPSEHSHALHPFYSIQHAHLLLIEYS